MCKYCNKKLNKNEISYNECDECTKDINYKTKG